jgi:hypothetical protein
MDQFQTLFRPLFPFALDGRSQQQSLWRRLDDEFRRKRNLDRKLERAPRLPRNINIFLAHVPELSFQYQRIDRDLRVWLLDGNKLDARWLSWFAFRLASDAT